MPEITPGDLPDLLLRNSKAQDSSGYWLLSLFHPSSDDQVDWTQGNYALHTRGGRVESKGDAKKPTRMVAEGSVLVSSAALLGEATDVAPDGFPHPVYRSGFALAVSLPVALVRVPPVRVAPPPPEPEPVAPSQLDLIAPEYVSPDDQAEDLAVEPASNRDRQEADPDPEKDPEGPEDAE